MAPDPWVAPPRPASPRPASPRSASPEQLADLLGSLFPSEYATERLVHDLGGTDRALQTVTLRHGRTVDLALDLEHRWLGTWCRVARVDICHYELHLHHHRRGSTASYCTGSVDVTGIEAPWSAAVELCTTLFERWNDEVERWSR